MKERSVLVVEDEDSIRETVVDLLRAEGFLVAEASDGAAGLALLQSNEPSMVLLDLMMPVLDGYGFLRAKRRLEAATKRRRRIPVLVMTACRDVVGLRRFDDVVDLLHKPFEVNDLLARIARHTRSISTEIPAAV
jgi:two-component system, chemotaxis family, chemotaxis protein CheY